MALIIAAALTNTTKTIGGSFASAIFGIVLAMRVLAAATSTASNLSGYLTVWVMCGIGALVAAVLLFFVPKLAFADVADELPGRGGDHPHRVTGEHYSFGASASRITLCGAACATGLMVTRSRFTNPGSSIECTIASAMSSACNGFTTLS